MFSVRYRARLSLQAAAVLVAWFAFGGLAFLEDVGLGSQACALPADLGQAIERDADETKAKDLPLASLSVDMAIHAVPFTVDRDQPLPQSFEFLDAAPSPLYQRYSSYRI